MPLQPSSHDFAALNGLRGLLAVWVVLGHTTDTIGRIIGYGGPGLAFLHLAYIAVDAFFLLSGFVMAHRYQSGAQNWAAYGDFIRKRIARIYPLYFVLFVAVFFTIGANPWGHGPYQIDIIRHVLLMQSWWNFSHFIWFNPAWSLSAEWAAYLLFPALFAFARQADVRKRNEFHAVIILLIYMTLHVFFADNNLRQFIQSSLFRVLPCFMIGMIIYNIYRRSTSLEYAPMADIAVAYLILTMAVLAITGAYQELWAGFILMPILVMIVYSLAFEKSALAKILTTKWVQWLGQISLSIYLLHYLIMRWAEPLAENDPALWLLVVYVGTLLGSAVTFRLIEHPMRGWLTQR